MNTNDNYLCIRTSANSCRGGLEFLHTDEGSFQNVEDYHLDVSDKDAMRILQELFDMIVREPESILRDHRIAMHFISPYEYSAEWKNDWIELTITKFKGECAVERVTLHYNKFIGNKRISTGIMETMQKLRNYMEEEQNESSSDGSLSGMKLDP